MEWSRNSFGLYSSHVPLFWSSWNYSSFIYDFHFPVISRKQIARFALSSSMLKYNEKKRLDENTAVKSTYEHKCQSWTEHFFARQAKTSIERGQRTKSSEYGVAYVRKIGVSKLNLGWALHTHTHARQLARSYAYAILPAQIFNFLSVVRMENNKC